MYQRRREGPSKMQRARLPNPNGDLSRPRAQVGCTYIGHCDSLSSLYRAVRSLQRDREGRLVNLPHDMVADASAVFCSLSCAVAISSCCLKQMRSPSSAICTSKGEGPWGVQRQNVAVLATGGHTGSAEGAACYPCGWGRRRRLPPQARSWAGGDSRGTAMRVEARRGQLRT